MKLNKKYIVAILVLLVIVIAIIRVLTQFSFGPLNLDAATTTSSVRFVSSTITADGVVTAQDLAMLHFQTGGKLTYLPLKEGDKVYQGQTVAQLDTYQLQRQLSAALNAYQSTRDSFDQTQANSQNNYLQAQQTYPYNVYNAAGIGGNTATSAINDAVKRIIDQNQANLNNSVINVELAHYALQLATLTSPLNGIVTHEDVTVSGQNITPVTTFTVADLETMVFRANIPTESIYYISEGSTVSMAIDGLPDKISGTVVKIYPSKIILPTGQAVYQVDIASDELKKNAKLDEAGTAIISTNAQNVALVPAWTIFGGKYIWVVEDGKPSIKQVTVGKIHGNNIEVIDGLSPTSKIIINPKYIPSLHYQML